MGEPLQVSENDNQEVADGTTDECVPQMTIEEMEACLPEDEVQDYMDETFLRANSYMIVGPEKLETKKEPSEVEDICDAVDDHEFMFIEKEEPELDESEDLESVVQDVLLQSAELVAQANESSEYAEAKILKMQSKNIPSFKSKFEPQFPAINTNIPEIRTTVSSTASIANFVTPKTSLNNFNIPNITTVQSQSRVSLATTTVPSQISRIMNESESISTLMQMKIFQNALHSQTSQAPMLQRRDLLQVSVPKVRNEQNMVGTPQIFDKTQKMNMVRMGMNRFSTNNPPLEVMENRLRRAMLQRQLATFGVPPFGFSLPSTSMPQETLLQNTSAPQLRGPPLAEPQQQSTAVRMQFVKNLNDRSERPIVPSRVGNMPRYRPTQKINVPPHLSLFSKPCASHIATQQRGLMSSAQQTIQHNSANPTSVQQRTSVSIPNATGQFQAVSVPHFSGNGSQLNVPQLHVSQLVANTVRLRLPLGPNIFVRPQGSIQPLFPPQPRIPQLPANLRQQIAANAHRLSAPQIVARGPHLRVAPLTTNVPRLNVPQMAANVPPVNFPQVAANALKFTGNLFPINAPHLSRSLSRPRVPLVPMSNIAQLGIPHFTKAVPRLPLPHLSPNIPQLPVPQFPANISHLGLRPGISNLVAKPPSDLPSGTSVDLQDVIARATHLANTIPKRPSNSLLMTAVECHADIASSTSSSSNGPKGFQEARNANSTVKKKCHMLPRKIQPTNLQHDGVSQHGYRKPQNITGVLQLQAGMLQHSANTSQQSASVLQQTKSRKNIISHSDKCQDQRRKQKSLHMLRLLQKKHMKRHIALLTLWKRFEKYHIGRSLFDVKRKKLREVRKHHLRIHQNQLNHQTNKL